MVFEVPELPTWAPGEEYANMLTHFIGVVFTFFAIFPIVHFAKKSRDKYKMISHCIFISSLLIMFCTSTIYHALDPCYLKRVFRLLDHISIFLLIAGGYTPIAMTILRPSNGKKFFVIEWVIALVGISFKIACFEAFETYSLYFYIGMGWVVLFNICDLISLMPRNGMICLLSEGAAFTSGVYFYNSYTPFYHAIWHIFVDIGAILHILCVFYFT
ncbi:Hemolysin-3 like protein [Tritrichomonas foetus]|uniref:Hemolysin-3 like protein n=1 Tax=Tritrichomonas foetus TaxID=1144522 RepID=A0A1J4JX71_9EUKA|nr:Hemolysin-3 like protein [Tritrichomonas foetus]|eukprot:OHT03595.1 Hemolysin-3 like protein [Tritrichomonas foetus]